MKRSIAIASGAVLIIAAAAALLSRPAQTDPLVQIQPFSGRAGRMPPVDVGGLQRITATTATLTISQDDGSPTLMGSCDPSDSAALEAMFLSTPVTVDEGIDRVPHESDLAAMISLSAQLISLLGPIGPESDQSLDQAARSLGAGSRPILERVLNSQPPEFRISEILALPPDVGGPSLRVQREDLDNMPAGTRLESIPIEVEMAVEYQTPEGTDRSVTVNFMYQSETSAWVLRSIGTIFDSGTMYRLFDDIEAQNKLIASARFSSDDPDGVPAVRNGAPFVLR
jgi:hypothetical protein